MHHAYNGKQFEYVMGNNNNIPQCYCVSVIFVVDKSNISEIEFCNAGNS